MGLLREDPLIVSITFTEEWLLESFKSMWKHVVLQIIDFADSTSVGEGSEIPADGTEMALGITS